MEDIMKEFSGSIKKAMESFYSGFKFPTEFYESIRKFSESFTKELNETRLFHEAMNYTRKDLKYEDILRLFDFYGNGDYEYLLEELLSNLNRDLELHRYLESVILNTDMTKREKIVVLLCHIDPLIYVAMDETKKSGEKIKQRTSAYVEKAKDGVSVKGLSKVFILGITHIIFANTASFEEDIDKRMPFRNNILHNGTLSYSDDEIDMAYDVLIGLMAMLIDFSTLHKE